MSVLLFLSAVCVPPTVPKTEEGCAALEELHGEESKALRYIKIYSMK